MEISLSDLQERWVYTVRGIYKLRKRPDFPRPARILPVRRSPRWREADIAAYEEAHPELTSQRLKRFKVIGFFRAIRRG